MNSLYNYFIYEYVSSPDSIYKSIKKLPQSCLAELDLESFKFSITPYFDWNYRFDKIHKISQQEALRVLEEKLTNSIKKRLISDVPLGVFLSGGLDSSTIVAILSNLIDIKNLKTFSIGFNEASFDESIYAKEVATLFGTKHYEKIFTVNEMINVIPKVIDLLDEPFADAFRIYS